MNRLDCDVLIIGSGAAGGTLAGTLSELTDWRIVLAEKGGYFGSEFFDQREWAMRVLYAREGRRATDDGAIPVRGGQCVGGGTTVNAALCMDPLPEVWRRWREQRSLEGLSFDPTAADYGVVGLNLGSCLAEVRERIHVGLPEAALVNDNNRRFEDGCRALGWSARRFELNLRGCIGSGYCEEGCAYDAKQGTMITYVRDALARGVRLIHHCALTRIELEQRRGRLAAVGATGRVRPTDPGSRPNAVPPGRIEICARLVVVACGAIESPLLLARSGLGGAGSPLGRGLVLHPSLPVVGVFARPLENYRGLPGTVYCDQFVASHGVYFEVLFGHPVYGAVVLPGIGPEHFERMSSLPRLAGFGVMLVDSSAAENRVERSYEAPGYRIRYRLTQESKERLRYAAARAVELMFAAGADEVVLASDEPLGPLAAPRFRDPAQARHCAELRFEPHRTTITSAHCQATVAMGHDEESSCLDSRCEMHGIDRLMVCDASSFPGSCGVNPMLSIMTLARYQGRRIVAERERYGL